MAAMSELAPEAMQHTIVIEPSLGQAGDGSPAYGPAVSVLGWLDAKRRIVRTQDGATDTGNEQVSESTFLCDRGPSVPAESRVTLPSGQQSRVLAVLDRDGGALDILPSHLEIVIA